MVKGIDVTECVKNFTYRQYPYGELVHLHVFRHFIGIKRYHNDMIQQLTGAIHSHELHGVVLLYTPMGVDYVVIGFDMEVQPLVTHNAA